MSQERPVSPTCWRLNGNVRKTLRCKLTGSRLKPEVGLDWSSYLASFFIFRRGNSSLPAPCGAWDAARRERPVRHHLLGDAHQIAERRADLRPGELGAFFPSLALAQHGIKLARHTGESRGGGRRECFQQIRSPVAGLALGSECCGVTGLLSSCIPACPMRHEISFGHKEIRRSGRASTRGAAACGKAARSAYGLPPIRAKASALGRGRGYIRRSCVVATQALLMHQSGGRDHPSRKHLPASDER